MATLNCSRMFYSFPIYYLHVCSVHTELVVQLSLRSISVHLFITVLFYDIFLWPITCVVYAG